MSTEREYDAQADLVDDEDPIHLSAGAGPHQPFFAERDPPPATPAADTGGGGTSALTTAGELFNSCEARPDEGPYSSWPNMNFSNPFGFPPSHMR